MDHPEIIGPVEEAHFHPESVSIAHSFSSLSGSFESSLAMLDDVFDTTGPSFYEGIALFTGIENQALLQSLHPSIMDTVEVMLDGCVGINGNQTLGLLELSTWHRNAEYWVQNTKQQAGYAAEIISTAKENIIAAAEGTGITTFRADDRPDLGFAKNDQYVDKVRVNSSGEIVERVQTKFVGDNGRDWVRKLMSKRFEKYLNDDLVDKIECPSDYYDDARAFISHSRESLRRQLLRTTADGNTEAAEAIQARIDRLDKLEGMMEKSTVSSHEASYARNHPRRYAAKLFANETLEESLEAGVSSATLAAGITLLSSAAIHGYECFNGEITPEEMANEIATEVATAGTVAGVTCFVSTAVASTMQSSSCTLIKNIGGSCLPASAVAFAVESYDSVVDYAQGAIGVDELAHDLGLNAASITGGTVVGGKVGAAAGTVFGPAGTVVGGLVGGLVGSTVACEVYETALIYAPDAAGAIAEQVETHAESVLDAIESEFPQQLDNARAAFNSFFESNGIPVSV